MLQYIFFAFAYETQGITAMLRSTIERATIERCPFRKNYAKL